MQNFFKKRWVYHSLIWMAGYLFLSFVDRDEDLSIIECLKAPFFQYAIIMGITYSNFTAKVYFFDRRKYLLYAFALISIVIGSLISFEIIKNWDTFNNTLMQNTINVFFIMLCSLGLQYLKRGIINQHQFQELKAKTIETELNALKAQINPHFLFNTLNNIYGMNKIDPSRGSEMILELSDVMRYHLEFSKRGLVKIEDEIQLLESYIKLEQLRLNDNCDVETDLEQIDGSLKISPLLFLPFVENAFKHGTHPIQACYIHLELKSDSDQLYFKIQNSVIRNRKIVKTNIGLENTKRRLELIYPEKHELKILKDEKQYSVELSIDL